MLCAQGHTAGLRQSQDWEAERPEPLGDPASPIAAVQVEVIPHLVKQRDGEDSRRVARGGGFVQSDPLVLVEILNFCRDGLNFPLA